MLAFANPSTGARCWQCLRAENAGVAAACGASTRPYNAWLQHI
jgi:hypothetical protein